MEAIGTTGFVYEFGKFVLDPKERTLFADGIPIRLPAKEFDTLLILIEHNGHALTKDEMMSAIWHDSIVEESNLAKQIWRLRKLFSTNGDQFIETLPKHGYRFKAELRRTIVESEDAVIFEKSTLKRVTLAIENGIEPDRPALPPAGRHRFALARLAAFLIVLLALGSLTWQYRRSIFPSKAAVIDPYAPVRLTDNPNDDTIPSWTHDGHIQFLRIYPDNHSETWMMNPDGTEQTLIKDPEGKHILGWSPNKQKVVFVKLNEPTKWYMANADGTAEVMLPARSGVWSPDSKMIAYHQKVSGDNWDIFIYSVETGKIQNITNNESFDADPSFSPDGNTVIFASSRDGNAEIYSMNPDGSGLRRLTNDPALDCHAAFSPDGTQISFSSDRENENGDVYIMNADGGNVTKLTDWDKSNETAEPGGWSPDGTKIVFFSDRNGKDDLYVVSAETVRPKLVLADPEHDLRSLSCSSDGKKIAYSKELEDKSGELRIFDLETRQESLVKRTEWANSSPDWSPDGNWIAFHDRIDGNSEICLIKPDGSELQNLTNDPSQDSSPSWSPDGKQIVFVSTRGEFPGAHQLYLINADGSGPHPITPRQGWEVEPVWSPDGEEIVFACDRVDAPGNLLDICAIGVNGSGERRILFHREHDSRPVVSPDGNRIAFVARSDSNLEIYLVNRDGSGLLRLTRDAADDYSPEWAPDGKNIFFSSNRGGKSAIYKLAIP